MALPWRTIEAVQTEEGRLELRQRGERDFLICVDGRVLMNSVAHRSEQALGTLACAHLKGAAQARVLVGGLGMGFTLKAILDTLPASARIEVAELNPMVETWCRGPLAALTDSAVTDPRVQVKISDVTHRIRRHAVENALEKLDAIILDLYTGPYMHSHKRDDPLFGSIAIRTTKAALKPGGVFAVWGEDYDAGFTKRLKQAGFVTTHHQPRRGGFRHVVYLGTKPAQ
ncbi:spermidine synthase [Desulfosarcina ovata subsp. sediminis]|uniref:Spermidine synthase n=1 Tax=Desulfosarcina ovata subsp. sediminis TaxID=885957 RepID=A0A5K7ZXV9_9BACT|nr:spermidine synthase [Desulfosarcina ovata]BBO85115.1 spermidine synthase [Desulfosarcina ovata subsp. sediminis]